MGAGKVGEKTSKRLLHRVRGCDLTSGPDGIGPAAQGGQIARKVPKMTNFTFTAPKQMAEEGSKVSRTFDFARTATGGWMIDNRVLHESVVDHCVAFALRQRIANSFASSGTLKKEKTDKAFLPLADREADFNEKIDAVFEKIVTHDVNKLPSWETVFTGATGESRIDPVTREVHAMVREGLKTWAEKKGMSLPKASTDEYKDLFAKWLKKFEATYIPIAESVVANRKAAVDADDFDPMMDDEEVEEESEEIEVKKARK